MYIKFKDEQGNQNLQEMNITAVKTAIWVDKVREEFYEMYNYNQPLAQGICEVISTLSEDSDTGVDWIDDIFSRSQIHFNKCAGLLPDELEVFMKAIQEALERGYKVFDVIAWNKDCLDKMRGYTCE